MANAMILAAGFGTRMRPLSNVRPKCLMPVMNRPLLGLWLHRLAAWGVERAVVNTHHLAAQVEDFLAENRPDGLEVRISREPVLLGTGGGLVAARNMLGERPFLLGNSDVLSTMEAPLLLEALLERGALAVLGLADQPRFNTVATQGGKVLGFQGDAALPPDARWLTYTGLAAISPRLLDYLPPKGESSLIDGLRTAMAGGERVLGRELPGYWNDLGTPERFWALHRDLTQTPPPGLEDLRPAARVVMAPGARAAQNAYLSGFAVLGQGAVIQSGARAHDSILLPGARVARGVAVRSAVLGDGFVARKAIEGGAHA